jgi:hypothetical protein
MPNKSSDVQNSMANLIAEHRNIQLQLTTELAPAGERKLSPEYIVQLHLFS